MSWTPPPERVLPGKDRVPMPKYEPVPIPTRGLPGYKQFLVMITTTRKIRLTADYIIWVECLGQYVLIPAGFACDLASVPRLFWPLIPPDGIFMIPGIVHDFLYRFDCLLDEERQVTQLDKGRHHADWIFRELSVQVNDMPITGYLGHLFLASGSVFSWMKHRRNNLWVGDHFPVNVAEVT
ncbi:MAG: DUF1353 domain-containing protein [Desulfobulbaceae bacterium]|nr:DUF1353 domain-containing protein [Desulfobulbaceae bacterium]